MRLFVVFFGIFLSGCFVFPRNGMFMSPRRMQIYPENEAYQGDHTPLQRVKAYWYHPRREGITRAQLARERGRGYTAAFRCRRHHSYVVDLALVQEVSIVRDGSDVIDVHYGGRYRGGYHNRQLICWAEGTVVRRGSDPPPTPSGLIRVRHCNRGRCGHWTRW